jgi:hypothetical protein
MPRAEFEPTVPVIEWAETFIALDRVATVMGADLRTLNSIISDNTNYGTACG